MVTLTLTRDELVYLRNAMNILRTHHYKHTDDQYIMLTAVGHPETWEGRRIIANLNRVDNKLRNIKLQYNPTIEWDEGYCSYVAKYPTHKAFAETPDEAYLAWLADVERSD